MEKCKRGGDEGWCFVTGIRRKCGYLFLSDYFLLFEITHSKLSSSIEKYLHGRS